MKGTSIITQKGPSIDIYRKEAIKIAKEIGYPRYTIKDLESANNITEINRILADARHEWDVDPGRYYKY